MRLPGAFFLCSPIYSSIPQVLKTVIKILVGVVTFFAAIAGIGAWVAPDFGKTMLSWAMRLMTDQTIAPTWLLLLLCLALVTMVGIFLRNWVLSRNPSKRSVHIADLSLNELLVIETMHQLDGESAYRSSLAQQLNLTKLEVDVALQSLEDRELVFSMMLPLAISTSSSTPKDFSSYSLSNQGKEFAVATLTQRRASIAKKKAKQS